MESATSPTPSTTRFSIAAVSSASFAPFSTAFREPSISTVVSRDASALLVARFLTSPATTANPLPLSPALAASTEAFSANILVWNAISSMALTILPISYDLFLSSCIASSISCIRVLLLAASLPTSATLLFAVAALSALADTCSDISLILSASSSTAPACSDAPCARDCAPSDTCSEPQETCSAEALI